MLFIILSLIIGILFMFFSKILEDKFNCDWGSVITFIISTALIMTFAFSSILAIVANFEAPSTTKELLIEQEVIEYKVNNLNKFIYDYEDTINDIKNWNEKIAGGQMKHNSILINWLYPIDYSQFHIVEIPG